MTFTDSGGTVASISNEANNTVVRTYLLFIGYLLRHRNGCQSDRFYNLTDIQDAGKVAGDLSSSHLSKGVELYGPGG